MLGRLRQAAGEDAAYKKMVELVREGTIRRYWLEQDLLYARGVESSCQRVSCENT